ncbi:MAG TPA: hypothetical protein VKR42_05130 [Ktedonobacteraceae bacterium]|nr:hypothetical protein [Ktedonobacteraceae bacterium]
MRRQQQQPQKDSSFEEIDEHDQPTEPMMPVVIAPFAPTQVNGLQPSRYPYLPPEPVKKQKQNGHRPAGGAAASLPVPTFPAAPVNQDYPVLPARPAKQVQAGQSPIPAFVGLFFVMVQLLLLVRFMLKLLNVSGNAKWLSIVYDVSDLFVFPFRLLLQNTVLSLSVSVEIYTLLAILIYGLFSRILVRFLKALLNSR